MSKEQVNKQNPNILRVIPDWREYFRQNSSILETQCVVVAGGGTIDSIVDYQNRLSPINHNVDIPSTENLSASAIAKLLSQHAQTRSSLGSLYPWTLRKTSKIPWIDTKVKYAGRISSFDSGQEKNNHFVAGLSFDKNTLDFVDKLIKTQGTDSLVDKSTLEAIIFSQYLQKTGKKIIAVGAAIPGYEENSDAVPNINGGLYAALENELPGGSYLISSETTKKGEPVTQILPALGSVKLHSDGRFHAPNSGPLLTIQNGTIFIHPHYHEMKRRMTNSSDLPDFTKTYLNNEESIDRLQIALDGVALESVKNDPSILEKHYENGKRAFVIKARGSGNASNEWKNAIAEILKRKDTIAMIITLADSGDVNLKKYSAGLNIPGVLSGRTLREEAACCLAGIIQDLKAHDQLPDQPQNIIESFCYLSGMIELPSLKKPLHL